MSSQVPYRRGQVSLQIWIDKKTHRASKAKLAQQGKTFRELITKFLRWYGETEGQNEVEADEDTKAD